MRNEYEDDRDIDEDACEEYLYAILLLAKEEEEEISSPES